MPATGASGRVAGTLQGGPDNAHRPGPLGWGEFDIDSVGILVSLALGPGKFGKNLPLYQVRFRMAGFDDFGTHRLSAVAAIRRSACCATEKEEEKGRAAEQETGRMKRWVHRVHPT